MTPYRKQYKLACVRYVLYRVRYGKTRTDKQLGPLYTENDMSARVTAGHRHDRSDPLVKLGRRIAGARAERGLSQIDVARAARTSAARISNIERAASDVRLDTLVRVAEAVGLEITLRERAA